jgi:hypothetical protein
MMEEWNREMLIERTRAGLARTVAMEPNLDANQFCLPVPRERSPFSETTVYPFRRSQTKSV